MEIIGKRCVKFHDDTVELSAAIGGGVRVYKGEELLFETQGERLDDLVEAVRFIETTVDPIATDILMPAKKAREGLVRVQLGLVEELIGISIKSGYSYTALRIDTDNDGEQAFRGMPLEDLLNHLVNAGYKTSWNDDDMFVISW